jgi:hypothetical protein
MACGKVRETDRQKSRQTGDGWFIGVIVQIHGAV